jgi:hypothetical protein
MAKAQKRGNKEAKKPKTVKPKVTAAAPSLIGRALGEQVQGKRAKGSK